MKFKDMSNAILKATIQDLGRSVQADPNSQAMAEFNSACDEWDSRTVAETRAAVNNTGPNSLPHPLIGRDGATLQNGPVNGHLFSQGGTAQDLALAGWVRNSHGEAVPRNEFEAAHAIGLDPRAGAFELALPTCRPTLGKNWHIAQNAGSRFDGPAGGFTVPETFMGSLESALKDYSGVLQFAEIMVTTDGREMFWPTIDDTGNTGSQIGENTDVGSATDMVFAAQKFHSYKLTSGVLKASAELIRDSGINIASTIGAKLGERLGRTLNAKATNGLGASTFDGLMTGVPTGKTCASQTAISFDELIDLQHSVNSAHRTGPGVGWSMNDLTAAHVRKLKNGSGDYIWSDSVQVGQPPMLLGHPVYFNADMVSSLTAGVKPIIFGKLSAFKVRLVGRVRFRQLNERYAELDQTGFIAFLEGDSHLLKPSSTDALCPIQALAMAS